MEITSVRTLWGFPPGNEYSMLTASSENMYHDRGETGSSHYCKLILSSAWNFWIIKKFPLCSSKELSSVACARMCPAARPNSLPGSPLGSCCFLRGLLYGLGGGGTRRIFCKPRKSVVELFFYFLSYFMQQ